MGAAKKKKTSRNYIWKDTKSVSDKLKKGQIPYVDFYPLKTNLGAKKDDYIIIDPKKPIDLRADRHDKWENIPKMARELYDTPFEAMQVLLKGASISNKDENRFILCCHIECDWKEKENKNLSLNALIDKNLENYCMFIGVPYSSINLSVRELQKKNKQPDKKNKEDRQEIIDRIVEKHRRLVKQQPDKFKKWMRDNEAHYRGPY